MTSAQTGPDLDATVVIPTHDRWPLVQVALHSVLAQRDARVRAIVVDDCSTDGTREGLDRVDDNRVVVLHHGLCRGVSAARNSGLAEVDTEWVAFLDDDDVLGPRHVSGMLRAAESRPDAAQVGLVYGGHVVTDRWRRPVSTSTAVSEEHVAGELLSANVVGPPSGVLLRTAAVRDAGGFDEELSILADWDMWIRISQRYILARSSESQVGYMRHPNNMHLAGDRFLREMSRLEAKHGATAAARGHQLLGGTLRLHVAASHRAAGRRVRASASYVRGFLHSRSPRHLALAVGVLLGERAIERSGMRTAAPSPPVVDWLDEIQRLQQLTIATPLAHAHGSPTVTLGSRAFRSVARGAARRLPRAMRVAARDVSQRRRGPFNLGDQDAREWHDRAEAAVELFIAAADTIRPEPGEVMRIADLGCGSMHLHEVIARRLGRPFRYRGYDLLPQAPSVDQIDLRRELPSAAFDVAFCLGLLEYLDDVSDFLGRLRERCRVGVISYALADAPVPVSPRQRRAFGWVSDYTRAQLEREFDRQGLAIRASTLVADGRTCIWVIEPLVS